MGGLPAWPRWKRPETLQELEQLLAAGVARQGVDLASGSFLHGFRTFLPVSLIRYNSMGSVGTGKMAILGGLLSQMKAVTVLTQQCQQQQRPVTDKSRKSSMTET